MTEILSKSEKVHSISSLCNSLNNLQINLRISTLQPTKSDDIEEEIRQTTLRNITNIEEGNSNLFSSEQKQGNLCGIYNFVTGQLVNDNYDVSKGIPKLLTKNIWKIKLKSGQNLMDLSGTLLLPHNVKEILSVTSTDPKTIPVYDDHYMWLLNPENMELLPTKDGIDLSIFPFNGKDYGNVPLFKYKNFTFKVKPEGNRMELYVTPPQGAGYSKEIENEIRSLIFKQESQIKENFNKVFNMINNFYNNND